MDQLRLMLKITPTFLTLRTVSIVILRVLICFGINCAVELTLPIAKDFDFLGLRQRTIEIYYPTNL